MFKSIICASFLTTLAMSNAAHAESHHHQHHNSPSAPIGVMGDHDHQTGEWMLTYRTSHMQMEGNQRGSGDVSTASVLGDFMVAPLDMSMNMQMFGAMFGATDEVTLMVMTPYINKSMRHVNRMGRQFSTHTKGLGDTQLSGMYRLSKGTHSLRLTTGVSLPTGSITERGDTLMGANRKLPYPMQLGSGTFDPLLGLTYQTDYARFGLGAQGNSSWRFGKNSQGYRLGNSFGVTAWAVRGLTDDISASLRFDGKHWGNIKGRDTDLNPAMVPTARTDLRGGKRLDALVGISFEPDYFNGHRLAGEFGVPIYQHLDGPQLQTDYRFTLGWQAAF